MPYSLYFIAFLSPRKAVDSYRQSLTILQEIGDRTGQGNALTGLGNIYQVLGEYPQAIESYRQSLAIFQEIGDRSGVGNALNGLGNIYQVLGEYPQAIESYRQSLAIFQEIGDRSGEGSSLGNLGNVYQVLGEYPRAIDAYQQSSAIFREIGDRTGEGNALNNLALAKHRQGNSAAALEEIRASIALAESIRTEVENLDLRQSFFATVSIRYRLYIDILMQLHRENPNRDYDKQAFQASENNRARTLTELLTEANLDIRQDVNSQLLQEEQRLIQELSNLEQRRSELVRSSYTNEERDRLVEERDLLLQELSNLETRIRRNNPAYADLKYPQPLTLEEIQSDVLD